MLTVCLQLIIYQKKAKNWFPYVICLNLESTFEGNIPQMSVKTHFEYL